MTEWVLIARDSNGRLNSYWANWGGCADDAQQDLEQWNAELVFPSNRPYEIQFATQEDMVMFLLRWA